MRIKLVNVTREAEETLTFREQQPEANCDGFSVVLEVLLQMLDKNSRYPLLVRNVFTPKSQVKTYMQVPKYSFLCVLNSITKEI